MRNHLSLGFRLFLRIPLILLVLLSTVWIGQATSVRSLNLSEMVSRADRIFWGHCLQVQKKMDPRLGMIVEEYTFQVDLAIKGNIEQEKVVFRQLAGREIGAGLPHYKPTESVLLMLFKDSRLGLTSPVGFEQGVFRVAKQGIRNPLLQNTRRNKNLAEGWTDPEMSRVGLGSAQVWALKRGEPIRLAELVEVIERIMDSHSDREAQ